MKLGISVEIGNYGQVTVNSENPAQLLNPEQLKISSAIDFYNLAKAISFLAFIVLVRCALNFVANNHEAVTQKSPNFFLFSKNKEKTNDPSHEVKLKM